MTRPRHLLLALLGLGLSACDTDSVPASASSPAISPSASASETDYGDDPETYDGMMSALSRRHPGFKGVVATTDGQRLLVLADNPSVLARSALMPELARQLGRGISSLAVERAGASAKSGARRDFHELYDVKIALRKAMFEGERITMLDVNEEAGTVDVGVLSDTDEQALRASLTNEQASVVRFVRYERAVNLVGTYTEVPRQESVHLSGTTTLRSLQTDQFRPLVSGPRTDFWNPRLQTGTWCTLGPIVRHSNGRYGFLTNAHCTVDRQQLDYTSFYQPSLPANDYVGAESQEAQYRSPWIGSHGFYADVAFVGTLSWTELSGYMTASDNCIGGACTENGTLTAVTGASPNLSVNMRVFKTGAKTGSTAGRINRTCLDLSGSDGLANLCQVEVVYDPAVASPTTLADGGDSGSAVMVSSGTPGANATTLAGILWGGRRDNPGLFYYSPWQGITGSTYGLPVQPVRASHGVVRNVPPPPPPCDPNEPC